MTRIGAASEGRHNLKNSARELPRNVQHRTRSRERGEKSNKSQNVEIRKRIAEKQDFWRKRNIMRKSYRKNHKGNQSEHPTDCEPIEKLGYAYDKRQPELIAEGGGLLDRPPPPPVGRRG